MGWVIMSERELNRVEVLAQVDDGRLSVDNAANMLDLTRRQIFVLYVTGYGITALHMGQPDAGIITYTDMETRARRIVDSAQTPVIADADKSYRRLLNVRHTVRGYEAAGVIAIQVENQEYPKKCEHTKGRRVVPPKDMAAKIKAPMTTDRARISC